MLDYTKFTDSMAKSIWDKAFFMDKIEDCNVIIDFGCADGSMLDMLAGIFQNKVYIGYDNDEKVLAMAKQRNADHDQVFIVGPDHLENALDAICERRDKSKVCLNFASVLHEIYSFPEEGGLDVIKHIVQKLEPEYITIRDMYFDSGRYFYDDKQLPDTFDVRTMADAKFCDDFERKFGRIDNWKNLCHFLMKYQWAENGWEKEMQENYFSLNMERFISDIGGGYIRLFTTTYLLPHLCCKWVREYNIFIPAIHTHAQFVLGRMKGD